MRVFMPSLSLGEKSYFNMLKITHKKNQFDRKCTIQILVLKNVINLINDTFKKKKTDYNLKKIFYKTWCLKKHDKIN